MDVTAAAAGLPHCCLPFKTSKLCCREGPEEAMGEGENSDNDGGKDKEDAEDMVGVADWDDWEEEEDAPLL